MPTYEYGCEACGKTWELEQRITEAPAKECPSCGKASAKRLISGGNFVLKGGGWYADGYGSAKPSASKEGAGDKKSSSSDAGKSDAGKSDAGGSKAQSGAADS